MIIEQREGIHEEKFTLVEEARETALEVAKEEDAKAKEAGPQAEVRELSVSQAQRSYT